MCAWGVCALGFGLSGSKGGAHLGTVIHPMMRPTLWFLEPGVVFLFGSCSGQVGRAGRVVWVLGRGLTTDFVFFCALDFMYPTVLFESNLCRTIRLFYKTFENRILNV